MTRLNYGRLQLSLDRDRGLSLLPSYLDLDLDRDRGLSV